MSLFPVIKYRDVPAAIEFLQRAFGFEPGLVVPGDDGAIRHAELWFADGAALLSTLDQAYERADKSAIGLYVVVADIDAHFARSRDEGAEIVMEPFDTDYGSRDYMARDPEGFDWYFGTYRPEKAAGA
jgi:uncharacterized glyoxalase superfamily protein PhnB